jgi:hypothetical protein
MMKTPQPAMSDPASVTFTPGTAYWNQRFEVQRTSGRLQSLSDTVDNTVLCTIDQFAQFFAMAREFAPELILELGRGPGNSTCAFIEAAHQLPNPCRIVSVCNSTLWHDVTEPRLLPAVGSSWFQPLQAVQADILTFDFATVLSGSRRVLIFWDAHGFDIAECVLGKLLPLVSSKDHLVLLHDMSDLRYCGEPEPDGDYPLWSGDQNGAGRFCIGNVCSKVPQAISIMDFTTRNRLTLESADHSIHTTIANDPQKNAEMQMLLGPMYSPDAHWFWFTLNEHPGPYKFPATESR